MSTSLGPDIYVAKYSDFNINSNTVKSLEFEGNTFTIKAYPNPSNGVYNLKLDEITNNSYITIYNNMGEKILRKKLDSNLFSIDISEKMPGLYYLILSHGKKKSSLKLLKTN
ncbi:MAG: T9SS type A sorting domain-containing protein [Saprospiraceae bacterium]|nr:T9SS type A sorting domain-containing protein [Saprospiraceae bacterium]